jgi:guanine deaminase
MHAQYLRTAIELAHRSAQAGGRPFGAVLIRDGAVLAEGANESLQTYDPSAHAELQAIRSACRAARAVRLQGAVMYASGHPCPMCLAAMHLVGIERAYFAYDQSDGAPYGLSTEALYSELSKPLAEQSLPLVHQPVRVPGIDLYEEWFERQRT